MSLSSFFYRILNLKNDEVKLLFGSFFFMFVIFASYAILRPIRDVAGLYNDKEILKWLFLATFIVVIIFSILSMWLSGFVARKKYIDSIFIFSSACLLVFFLALWWIPRESAYKESAYFIWLMRVFYVWVSVFIMFVLSSAWSLLVDVFSKERSQRLFGIITAGVSLGGIAGSNIVLFLSKFLQLQDFILISMALLFVAIWLKSFIINSAYELLEKETQAQEIIKNENSPKNSAKINNTESLDSGIGAPAALESSAQKKYIKIQRRI